MKKVSYEYDRWVVDTQLCKLRDTSDTLIGRACAMFQIYIYHVIYVVYNIITCITDICPVFHDFV